MDNESLYDFLSTFQYGVLSTVTIDQKSQSAFMAIAITPDLKIIFDATPDSRKIKNIKNNPNVSLVIGGEDDVTVQYEGLAKILDPIIDRKILREYFQIFPEGKKKYLDWPDIIYCCVEPKFIRYSNFNQPVKIKEIHF